MQPDLWRPENAEEHRSYFLITDERYPVCILYAFDEYPL